MEDGMEKRLLVSFALSILVLVGYGWLFSPEEPVEPIPSEVIATTTQTLPGATTQLPPTPAQEAEVAATGAQIDPSVDGEAVAAVVIQAAIEQDFTVDTAVYSARFTNRGGLLASIRLRDYVDGEGNLLELISSEVAGTTGLPLALSTGDSQINETLSNALYVVEQDGLNIRMNYVAEGLSASKEVRFDPDTYQFEIDAEVLRDGVAVPFSFVWQGYFGERLNSELRSARVQENNIVYREGTSFERLGMGSIESPNDVVPTAYLGVEDRYFLAMFLLPGAQAPTVSSVDVDFGDGELLPSARVQAPHLGDPVVVYVGPQQQDRLAEVDTALATSIDYGIFGVLSRPMMFGLVVIHGFVGNYGWSIIVLTIFINFVFFPLRLKQQLSMQKMQKIQPQMRTLQDKYKKLKPNDPRRPEVQTEMMGLYKKHGVNPLGSCFPLLLQMPFLIAIFWALQVAVELRQAPWMLWIQDLSAADPYYVLPLLFGVAMFTQQKMTPSAMDPMQARIMMMMPIMMTVLFIRSQSGLMVYWVTSTVFGIGQQFLIRRYWPSDTPKRVPARTPVEEKPAIEAEVVSAQDEDDSSDSKRRKRRRKK